ncbi:hypothetical protein OG730_41545 (plasmid) [Streptomyces sp. NBC_01298]|uniref:hypothetical protein n=1 Tax=Streptomyces sp. NBC_01298 TaxID=2903817 RepID=UPI002E0F6C9F|nr:hypothetical protein OG730_42480 [Streptomyces sp. NBC_01298]WSK25954.1 hypothetical protein OG730_41545 [Streptomyces sp. NBC_01298]
MSDNIASEHTVGEHTIHGRRVEVHRLTWKDHPGLSFEVIDAETGDLLTETESFDDYPTEEQLTALVEASNTADAQSGDGHEDCFGAHVTADGHADCDGNVL